MYHSPIIRMTAGPINRINDPVVGMLATPIGPGVSKFTGQLGAGVWLDDANILFDSAMGTVYGGHFRYVRLNAAASAVVVGQIVFWSTLAVAANNLYEVTTLETGSTDGAMLSAGIVLNSGWTPGRYSVIQDIGTVFVQFRAALTAVGAPGSRVFCAAAGAGVDNGFADVIDSAAAAAIQDVSRMQGRYLGVALDTPLNGGLQRVDIHLHNMKA